jgi:hypothetical protein
MAEIWQPRDFLIAHVAGPQTVPGYVYRGLGIHMQMKGSPKGRRKPVWALTHLNTGHAICRLHGLVADAFPIATEVAECSDWAGFDGLTGWRNQDPDLPEKVKAIAAKNPKIMTSGGSVSSHEAALAVAEARA